MSPSTSTGTASCIPRVRAISSSAASSSKQLGKNPKTKRGSYQYLSVHCRIFYNDPVRREPMVVLEPSSLKFCLEFVLLILLALILVLIEV